MTFLLRKIQVTQAKCWDAFKRLFLCWKMHWSKLLPFEFGFFLKVPTHEKDQIWKSCKKFVKSLWQKFVVNIKIETYFFPLIVFLSYFRKCPIFSITINSKTFLYSNLDNENMIQCMLYFVKRFEIYVTLIIIHSKLFSFLSRPTYII